MTRKDKFITAVAACVAVLAGASSAARVEEYSYRPTAASSAAARDFLENLKSFRLGFLPTERSNPITASLERDFRRSSVDGVECLQRADRQVPIAMRHVVVSEEYKALVDAMEAALRSEKGRIVFTGCGATGRLSMLLESMWRDFFSRRSGELSAAERALGDRVLSIMTAGDFALIKSVEFFEDYWEGGARQTDSLGVGPGDVIVALNGGGECSTILGSVMRGVERGARGFMNVNNPKELLRRIERARKVIDDPRMTILDFYCGSMALAGSTRMQSTTTQQFIYCAALETALARIMPRFAGELSGDFVGTLEDVMASLESPAGRRGLAAAIEFEKGVYEAGGRITYIADDCMLDLFTDNTERSPTFMLPQLCSSEDSKGVQSWAFVKNPLYATPDCWARMLRREPRCLEGFSSADARALGMPQRIIDNPPKIGRADLMKYMIGNEPAPERIKGFPRAVAVVFSVGEPDAKFSAAAAKLASAWPERMEFHIGRAARPHAAAAGGPRSVAAAATNIPAFMPHSPLEMWRHLAVKLVINNLSTGTMTAMGRVAGNYMSWVSISNNKLTDRGCRLLRDLGDISYEEAAERLFAAQEWINAHDWSGKERPCAVQLALNDLRAERCGSPAAPFALDGAKVDFDFILGDLNEAKPSVHVRAADMDHMQTATNGDSSISVKWTGHPRAGKDFCVRAVFSPREDGGYDWSLAYSGYGCPLQVEAIRFPVLTVPRTGSTRIFYPHDEGTVKLPDWNAASPGTPLASAGPSCKAFNFISTLSPDSQDWYLDARGDARLSVVTFKISQGRERDSAEMSCETAMPIVDGAPPREGKIPFGGVIRRFDGDGWFSRVAYYREWAKKQKWYADAKELRSKAPRLRDIGLLLWNRGSSALVTGIVDRVARDTGATIALDWYWWHVNPYGRDAPYYWPAREDMDVFKGTIRALKDKGVYVQHYINGVCCDTMDRRWTDGDWAETIVDRNGKYHVHTWNPFFKHPSAYMCGNAPVFHDRVASLCRNLRECGTDSVYIDMIAHCHIPCWSAEHGHPRGGGTHQYEGYRRLVERVRRENPGTHFSSEGATERYLGLWESLILLQSSYEKLFRWTAPRFECVPAYQAIYHPVVTMYGNYATIDNQPPWDDLWPAECARGDLGDLVTGCPDEFAVEVARPVVRGMQPSAHQLFARHADDPKTAASYAFLCETVKFYVKNRDWLYDGEMLDPGRMECPAAEVKFLNYATYSPKGSEKTVVQKALPTVFHSVWRAPDGRVAAIFANWSREGRRFRLVSPDVGAVEGEIPPRSWKAFVREKASLPPSLRTGK